MFYPYLSTIILLARFQLLCVTYNVIFPFKFKIQTKILSSALFRRWLMKCSFKATNEKRRVITIYIFIPHNKFYLFKYNTCNTWGTCIIIWLERVRGILRQMRKKKSSKISKCAEWWEKKFCVSKIKKESIVSEKCRHEVDAWWKE